MTLALAVVVGISCTAGAYLVLSRDVVRTVLGIIVMSGGANLALIAAGRPGSSQPAVILRGEVVAHGVSNPVPQALVLTALVIGFVLACIAFALAVRLVYATGSDDLDALDSAEPPPEHGGPYPALEVDVDPGEAPR